MYRGKPLESRVKAKDLLKGLFYITPLLNSTKEFCLKMEEATLNSPLMKTRGKHLAN